MHSITISTSLHDFSPFFRGPEFVYRQLQHTGIDGIELVVGMKSRFSVSRYKELSKKYNLPIKSLHQPPWAVLGIYFDEDFFRMASEFNVKTVTCHPLPWFTLQSKQMRSYAAHLAKVQKKFKLEILLENMPIQYNQFGIKQLFKLHPSTADALQLAALAKEFGLHLTLDIDHLRLPYPHKEQWFLKVFPLIRNIHLSNFSGKKTHLPIYLGELHTKEFVQSVRKKEYSGLWTFEIDYPSSVTLWEFDAKAIKKSVSLFKSF